MSRVLKEKDKGDQYPKTCCNFIDTGKFDEVIKKFLPRIKDASSANLFFLDQFGVRDSSPNHISIFLKAKALRTFSTSVPRRFSEETGFKEMFPGEILKFIEYKTIHRYLTTWFKKPQILILSARFRGFFY